MQQMQNRMNFFIAQSLQGDFQPSGLLRWIAMVCSFVSLCTQMLSRAGVSRVSRGIALDWIVEMQTRPPALPGLFRWIATDCFCVSLCTKMLNSCHPSQQMDCHGLSWCRAKLLYTDTQPIKMYSPGFQKREKFSRMSKFKVWIVLLRGQVEFNCRNRIPSR